MPDPPPCAYHDLPFSHLPGRINHFIMTLKRKGAVNITGIQLEPAWHGNSKTAVVEVDGLTPSRTPSDYMRNFLPDAFFQLSTRKLSKSVLGNNDRPLSANKRDTILSLDSIRKFAYIILERQFVPARRGPGIQAYFSQNKERGPFSLNDYELIATHIRFDYDQAAVVLTQTNLAFFRPMRTVCLDEAGIGGKVAGSSPRSAAMKTKGKGRFIAVYRLATVLRKTKKRVILAFCFELKNKKRTPYDLLGWATTQVQGCRDQVHLVGDSGFFDESFLQRHPENNITVHYPSVRAGTEGDVLALGLAPGQHRHFRLQNVLFSARESEGDIHLAMSTAWKVPEDIPRPPRFADRLPLLSSAGVKVLDGLADADLRSLANAVGFRTCELLLLLILR